MSSYLAVIGLYEEALAVSDETQLYALLELGRPMEAVAMAEARLAENPDSSDNVQTLMEFQGYAGIYSPEIRAQWEEWWEEIPEQFLMNGKILLIDMRRAAHEEFDDIIRIMKNDSGRSIEAGFKFYDDGTGLTELGAATFLEGNKAEGLDMLKQAAERGEYFKLNMGFLQDFYEHPGFVPILAIQEARQQREREKLLAIVCIDSPYEAVWQPQPGTCEAYEAEQAK
jgi:hypothetical protein